MEVGFLVQAGCHTASIWHSRPGQPPSTISSQTSPWIATRQTCPPAAEQETQAMDL